MNPAPDDLEAVVHLLRQAYQAPPPSDTFVQSLGRRLEEELQAQQQGGRLRPRRSRRWLLGIALAASLLVGTLLLFLAHQQRAGQNPSPSEPALVREPLNSGRGSEKAPPDTVKDESLPTR